MKHFEHYEWQEKLKKEGKIYSLGLTSGSTYFIDPRRLSFTLARYKFVSKILAGKKNVLEVGCGDGFASRIVRQSVDYLLGIDIEPSFIIDAKTRVDDQFQVNFECYNILEAPYPSSFDAVYSLDVLEHIESTNEPIFIKNIAASLDRKGVFVVGMPSLESQEYASGKGYNGHINCQSGTQLKNTLLNYYENVFLFSMNDEVVHTGFEKMAHYILCVCTHPLR